MVVLTTSAVVGVTYLLLRYRFKRRPPRCRWCRNPVFSAGGRGLYCVTDACPGWSRGALRFWELR